MGQWLGCPPKERMLLDVVHETRYDYACDVRTGRHVAHGGAHHRLHVAVTVSPA